MHYFLVILGLLLTSINCQATPHCIEKIPKKIWQTYKTKSLPERPAELQKTWISQNPKYSYQLFDDADIERYIIERWDADTLNFFKSFPLGVMKADLWRYLILTTEGGIYSDVDSICNLPIQKWAQKEKTHSKNVLLVGLENNSDFCQWTIACSANHPAMKYVCSFLVARWKKEGIDINNPHFVHKTTGPSVWTDALVSYLGIPTDGVPRENITGYIYQLYQTNAKMRKRIRKKGIFLFPQSFYAGEASQNLYGSQGFGDGYVRWTEERERLRQQHQAYTNKMMNRFLP